MPTIEKPLIRIASESRNTIDQRNLERTRDLASIVKKEYGNKLVDCGMFGELWGRVVCAGVIAGAKKKELIIKWMHEADYTKKNDLPYSELSDRFILHSQRVRSRKHIFVLSVEALILGTNDDLTYMMVQMYKEYRDIGN